MKNIDVISHIKSNYEGVIESIDEEVLDIFDEIHLMPDAHIGKSVPIGFVGKVKNKLLPNIVGVDIGCGMSSLRFKAPDLNKETVLKGLDTFIKKNIPSGKGQVHDSVDFDPNIYSVLGDYFIKWVGGTSALEYFERSLGTLGGGNHFIELGYCKDTDTYLLTVHSGSRNLGVKINEYFNRLLVKKRLGRGDYCKKVIEKLKAAGRQTEIPAFLESVKNWNSTTPAYLQGKMLEKYIESAQYAVDFAKESRVKILNTVFNYLRPFTDLSDEMEISDLILDTPHNYYNVKQGIVRKGAISAEKDEVCIIPINMRDGIILGRGKGNQGWLFSAPHGAGRVLSRKKAKEGLNLSEEVKGVSEVYTSTLTETTLDEAPNAYRGIETILENIEETITIDEIFKPIYNFKGQ